MKPDWKDAPEWAQYLARDEDGRWFWYEAKPDLLSDGWWLSNDRGRQEWIDEGYWDETLEPRP